MSRTLLLIVDVQDILLERIYYMLYMMNISVRPRTICLLDNKRYTSTRAAKITFTSTSTEHQVTLLDVTIIPEVSESFISVSCIMMS